MLRAATLALVLLLAGCTTPETSDDDTNSTSPTPPTMADLPAPIEESKTVSGGADPTNFAGAPVCSAPTAACERYPFELNATAMIVAGLSWGVPANDFDLYLFKDGEPTEIMSASNPPGTTEQFEESIDAGSYEVVVVPWAVSQDTFTLTVTFEPAAAAEVNETAAR